MPKKMISPMCCKKGHVFCKECIYQYILQKKKDIDSLVNQYEIQQSKLKEDNLLKQNMEKQQEIQQFDMKVNGISVTSNVQQVTSVSSQKNSNVPEGFQTIQTPTGKLLVPKDQPKTKSDDTKEKEDNQRKTLNSFWVPGVGVDTHVISLMEKPSKDIKCPAGNHNIRLKQLTKINFKESKDEDALFECPVCCRPFNKSSKACVLEECGHVACVSCFDKVKQSSLCFECSKKFKEKEVIKLEATGTSYAGSVGEKLTAKVVTPTPWF